MCHKMFALLPPVVHWTALDYLVLRSHLHLADQANIQGEVNINQLVSCEWT